MSTLTAPSTHRTHESSKSVHFHDFGRCVDTVRAAIAYRLTARLSGRNEKQTAQAFERDRSTVNRWFRGEVPTSYARFRRDLRKMVAGGTFPVAILADAVAEGWTEAVRGWSLEEKEARLRDLMRDEEHATHLVNLWQQRFLAGLPYDIQEASELLLEQAVRTIEIFVLMWDIEIHRQAVAA